MALDVNIALATVADVTTELGIAAASPSQIAMIEDLITAYSDAVANYIGRPLGYAANVVDGIRGYGSSPRITLKRTPILSVTSISTDDGVTQTLWADIAGARIEDDGKSGIVWMPCAAGFSGYRTRSATPSPITGTERECVLVTYSGGWKLPGQTGLLAGVKILPGDIRRAVVLGVATEFKRSGSGAGSSSSGVAAESLMSHSVTYRSDSEFVANFGSGYSSIGLFIPANMQHALAKYQTISQF